MDERARLSDRLRPYVERAAAFSGWTFEAPPMLGPPPSWSYTSRARELLRGAPSVVDLGTGGGERLAEILDGYAGLALATEEWGTNVPVAARRLRPRGAGVVHCQSMHLPFADGRVHLLLSRHEAIDPFEVARVLAPGGTVLTRQVENRDWSELCDYFPRWTDHGDHFAYYGAGFIAAGLTLVSARRHWREAVYPLEELVYRLCVMPWWIADFDPLGDDLDALLALETGLSTRAGIVLSEGRYMIEARKPG